jgi:AcrR family transcriptional regulator
VRGTAAGRATCSARRVGIAAPSIYRHFPDQPALVLAVLRQAFAELSDRLRSSVDLAGDDPRLRLHALCQAYPAFARDHPERYRTMFGLLGTSANGIGSDDLTGLGGEALRLVAETLTACVAAGCCTSDDPAADAVALWLGLHGLAHQRSVGPSRWSADIARRISNSLSHLV